MERKYDDAEVIHYTASGQAVIGTSAFLSGLDHSSCCDRFGNRVPVLAHTLEVQRDGLFDKLFHFLPGFGYGHTAGQVRHGSAITRGAFLDQNSVVHRLFSWIWAW